MASHAMKPIAALADYCGDGNPVIVQEFRSGRGWRNTGWRKRASASWLRKLRADGVTHVAVETPRGTLADFAVGELTAKTGLRG